MMLYFPSDGNYANIYVSNSGSESTAKSGEGGEGGSWRTDYVC